MLLFYATVTKSLSAFLLCYMLLVFTGLFLDSGRKFLAGELDLL